MIDAETFLKNSPFKMTHGDSQNSYNLSNTTPDLLKFQLQEQYRNQLQDLKNSQLSGLKLLNTEIFENSFNDHLQNQVELGNVNMIARGENSTSPESTITSVFSENDEDDNASDNLDTVVASSSSKLNYLNLKVLIENSVFDTRNINNDSILSLSDLSNLKNQIEVKSDLKQYLLSKISISQQFINDIIFRETQTEENQETIGTKSLIKVMKSNSTLQSQLIKVTTELEDLTKQLNNHNLSCLVLGYIEDIRASSAGPMMSKSSEQDPPLTPLDSPGSNNRITGSFIPSSTPRTDTFSKIYDTLFAHVASIAASRNITLPPLPSPGESPDTNIKWVQHCIDTIIADQTPAPAAEVSVPARDTSMSNITNSSIILSGQYSPTRGTVNPDKVLIEYKTALNDLRFSYQYLAKEYEHSRDSFNKVISEYKKKVTHLEGLVQRNQMLTSPPDSATSTTTPTYDSLEVKEKEISRLRKELNLLRVENIRKDQSISPGSGSSTDLPDPINSELFQMMHLTISHDEGDETNSLQSNRPSSVNGLSTGILRKEFRKIVGDIQDQYELELAQERLQRRQLAEELEQLKQA
ncbi:hypothetical protein JA1_000448 [Spathaspora sp. JA1]|nr:hypothetical protein JA1_000448 [Spathaspora sp. JA1]